MLVIPSWDSILQFLNKLYSYLCIVVPFQLVSNKFHIYFYLDLKEKKQNFTSCSLVDTVKPLIEDSKDNP